MKKILKLFSYAFLFVITTILVTGCFSKIRDEDKAKNDKNISLGEWNGDVYTNTFLGIKYIKPREWSKYSDDEIARLSNITNEYIEDKSGFNTKTLDLTTVYYLMTSDPNTGNNLILVSEKALKKNETIDNFIEDFKKQYGLISKNYRFLETNQESINGFNYATIALSETDSDGIVTYQKLYIRKIDNYFVYIVATSFNNISEFDKMIISFEKLN